MSSNCVWGMQGHAHCLILLCQQLLFLCHLNIVKIIGLSQVYVKYGQPYVLVILSNSVAFLYDFVFHMAVFHCFS